MRRIADYVPLRGGRFTPNTPGDNNMSITKRLGERGADRLGGFQPKRIALGAAFMLATAGAVALTAPAGHAAQGPTCFGVSATIIGTQGADSLVGTSGRDVIVGRGGGDTIRGAGGHDLICGNDGNDLIFGDKGGLSLPGVDGNDRISGGDVRDRLFGEGGDDELRGGTGNDTLRGGPGNDTVQGDVGADEHEGNEGNDRLRAQDNTQDLSVNGGPGFDDCDTDAVDPRTACET